jgi:uncharacterized phage protein (TIGR01671 family)
MGGGIMREIKFRGKRIDNGEWIYGFFVFDEFKGFEGKAGIAFADSPLGFEVIEVDVETVGQYTGHKNKDGKEIYDGDICVSLDGLFLVVWNEEKAAFEMMFKEDGERLYLEEMWDDTKVIGNLHDNLDLWEVV